jgi:predicted enzyme related to lactoylglutathione lyase
MANNRVIHFEIQADDVNRAKDFYEKTLGWKITQAMKKEDGGMDYWMIETGEGPGINGGMYSRPQKDEGKFYLYDCTVMVENIDKAIADFKANGGSIRLTNGQEKNEIPGIGWFAGAIDTEGNRVGLMQPTEWKPK